MIKVLPAFLLANQVAVVVLGTKESKYNCIRVQFLLIDLVRINFY